MKYSSIISRENLQLAWRRILTGRNMQYKRFFRPIYMAFEVSHEDNLEYLHRRLRGSWHPTPPVKIYLPKRSGLQRPLSLLTIEDQIVYQAVANAFSDKLCERRKNVEKKVVFSNLLNTPKNSVFYVQDWHKTYTEFQSKCIEHYMDGYRWIAHFDLAAFYDTISHELLIRRVSPRRGNQYTWKKVKNWLNTWCTSPDNVAYQHGIPQGPIASDFLAECLLLPLDEIMQSNGVRYVRYVDDIRIFSNSSINAQKSALKLEEYCRGLGLIPQARKFSIEEAKSFSQVLGILPSIAPPDRIEAGGPPIEMEEDEATEKFATSITGRPYRISNKSVARYVLYRAPKSAKLLNWVLRLLPRHPEHIDAFSAYLSNYSKSMPIERTASNILKAGIPYQYLRGELWHILGRISSPEMCQEMIPYALDDLRQHDAQLTLKWGALSFLISCQRRNLGLFAHRLRHQHPLIQAFLIPVIPDSEYGRVNLIKGLLSSKDYLPGLMLAEQLVRRNQTHLDYGMRVRDLAPQVQNTFRTLGIIRRRSGINVDQTGEILAQRYNCPTIMKWRSFLKDEYTHALQILLQAEALYEVGRSEWLMLQNSFNDALVRAFIAFLNANHLPGGRSLIGRDQRNIKFGVLLYPGNPFDISHPDVTGPFREVNIRRNTLPGSHPYDEKGGAQNRYLSLPEQNHLRTRLCLAYSALINFVDQSA